MSEFVSVILKLFGCFYLREISNYLIDLVFCSIENAIDYGWLLL